MSARPLAIVTAEPRKLRGLLEVAAILSVSPSTLRRAVASGRLPCRRVGDRLLFADVDVDAFIERCASGPQRRTRGR